MNDPHSSPEDLPPEALSPEALDALRRARRSFGISIGILLLGFMAIGFALVYRVMRDAPPPAVVEEVVLPGDVEVLAAVLAEGNINVTYRDGTNVWLVVFDRGTGEEVSRIRISDSSTSLD